MRPQSYTPTKSNVVVCQHYIPGRRDVKVFGELYDEMKTIDVLGCPSPSRPNLQGVAAQFAGEDDLQDRGC